MQKQWQTMEEAAARLISIVANSCDSELVRELDAMTSEQMRSVVTHVTRNGDTALHLAAARERLEGLKAMLRVKVDVNVKDGNGSSPLYLCLCRNALSSANLLIQHGADVNEAYHRATGETLLHKMVKGDQARAVELLLDSGVTPDLATRDGDTALHYSARYHRLAMAQLLVHAGLDITATNAKGQTALHVAIESKSIDVAKLLVKASGYANVKDRTGMTALHAAVTAGSTELVTLMLTNNSSQINTKETALGRTPLLLACSNGGNKMASLLLSHGADANLTTNYRKSVLHAAAGCGNNGALDAVIKFTTNINALAINNKTPLHYAVSGKHEDVARSLLRAGANPDLRDIDGNTALHLAAAGGDSATVLVLLQYSPQVNATNMKQRTALHLASMAGDEVTCWVLLRAGCDPHKVDVRGRRAKDYLHSLVPESEASLEEQKSSRSSGAIEGVNVDDVMTPSGDSFDITTDAVDERSVQEVEDDLSRLTRPGTADVTQAEDVPGQSVPILDLSALHVGDGVQTLPLLPLSVDASTNRSPRTGESVEEAESSYVSEEMHVHDDDNDDDVDDDEHDNDADKDLSPTQRDSTTTDVMDTPRRRHRGRGHSHDHKHGKHSKGTKPVKPSGKGTILRHGELVREGSTSRDHKHQRKRKLGVVTMNK